jgi:hypothetical protein
MKKEMLAPDSNEVRQELDEKGIHKTGDTAVESSELHPPVALTSAVAQATPNNNMAPNETAVRPAETENGERAPLAEDLSVEECFAEENDEPVPNAPGGLRPLLPFEDEQALTRRDDRPPDPKKKRRTKALELFLRLVRRFRRNPPTTKIGEMLVVAGEHPLGAEGFVKKCVAVVQAAMRKCVDRQEAFVLAAMELSARQGSQHNDESDIAQLTGQRPHIVRAQLQALSKKGLLSPSSNRYYPRYELTKPLLTAEEERPLSLLEDPTDLLRLAEDELNAIPADEFKAATIDTVLRAGEDHLSQEEEGLLTELAQCAKDEAADKLLEYELRQRRNQRDGRIGDLKSNLSRVRWGRRKRLLPWTPGDGTRA